MQQFFSTAGSTALTIVVSVLVFGFVIFFHELGHFMTAKLSGIRVLEFALGMGPTLFSVERGGTKYAVRLFPIGGFVMMEGEDEESDAIDSFARAPVGSRLLVTAAGAFMNFVLGFIILLAVVLMEDGITSRTVAEFYPDATTQASGLQVGDTIIAVNGRRCFIADDVSYEFARTPDSHADLTVLRDGKKITLEDVQFDTAEQDGVEYMIIDFLVYPVEKTPVNVLREAGNWTLSYARLVMLSFTDLLTGRAAVNDLSGPVGIVTVIGQATAIGLRPLLLLVALLTINLGIFNLLPIPALDGGRLFFLLVEAVRRKPIDQKYEIAINSAGFVLLIGLMLFATYNDITRLIQ